MKARLPLIGILLLLLGSLGIASLQAARLVNGQFEVALTLLALASLSRTLGKDFHPTLIESRALLEQLGVVRTPPIPWPVGEPA